MHGALLVGWDEVTGDELRQFADLENMVGRAVVGRGSQDTESWGNLALSAQRPPHDIPSDADDRTNNHTRRSRG